MGEEVNRLFIQTARKSLEESTSKLLRCLTLLPEEELWKRPNSHTNSVGNLVLHLCGNVRQWIISGIGGAEDIRQRPEEFLHDASYPKRELEAMVRRTAEEAGQTLADFDSKLLAEERTIQGFHVTCMEAIFDSVAHYSHHVGQILYIAKATLNQDLELTRLTPEGFKSEHE